MDRTSKTRRDALQIRMASGTRALEGTAERAVAALALKGIPSLLCGGLAVQEYGYPRMTNDVDLIVPDVKEAYAVLSLAGFKPAREVPGLVGFMTDRENKVTLDLLPAGGTIENAPVHFPMPQTVSKKPILVSLQDLISLKLSSWSTAGAKRSRDHSDVAELIMRRKLPRDLDVNSKVQALYQSLWDELQ